MTQQGSGESARLVAGVLARVMAAMVPWLHVGFTCSFLLIARSFAWCRNGDSREGHCLLVAGMVTVVLGN